MDYFDLDIGEVTAVLLYVKTIMNNVGALTNNYQQVSKVFGASYEIAVLIVTPCEIEHLGTEQPDMTTPIGGSVKLEDIRFCYPSKPNVEVLKGVNIDIEKNKIVALVGHSGCGKSSIISLIERFYDPKEGKMLFSGVEIKDLDNKWYHQKQLALVQ